MSTLTELQERLALYKAAEKAILEHSQEYQVGKRRLTRASLPEIRSEINNLEARIAATQNGGLFGHSVTVFGGRR
ncbi:MAG: hypothetical protein OEY01_14390 [Desulfobulbaceae bacterium]|nr:hypothetical protein [Desulfobulbaceae bacterium]